MHDIKCAVIKHSFFITRIDAHTFVSPLSLPSGRRRHGRRTVELIGHNRENRGLHGETFCVVRNVDKRFGLFLVPGPKGPWDQGHGPGRALGPRLHRPMGPWAQWPHGTWACRWSPEVLEQLEGYKVLLARLEEHHGKPTLEKFMEQRNQYKNLHKKPHERYREFINLSI